LCDLVNLGGTGFAHSPGELEQPRRIRAITRSPGGGLEQSGAFECFASQPRDASAEFGSELLLPPAKRIGPCLDCVFVNRDIVETANATPAVIIEVSHGRFPPSSFPENAPLLDSRNHIMPVFKNVRSDDEIFADDAFYRVATAVNQRV
jgi:hypothetical protein